MDKAVTLTGKVWIMENRSVSKILAGILCLILLLSFASCANLPSKVVPEILATQAAEKPDEDEEDVMISRPEDPGEFIPDVVWTGPETGPTVTAIVLIPEQAGKEGGIIERDDIVYEDEGFIEATPVPTALPGGLKDEMTVYRFAPVSGAVVLPGQALHLDITLQNTGTTVWQTSYKIVDYSNDPMTVQREYNLPRAVAPGETVLVSVYMTAPSYMGSYPANFSIKDAYGVVFGNFDYLLTVGEFSSITEIPTLTATITPTYYSPLGITATPDSLAWMCIDPERSLLQDCYQFCVEYSDREEFQYCFYDGVRYKTPEP